MNQTEVRSKLNTVIKEQGVKAKFIANGLKWNYQNLIAFKNGKLNYGTDRLRQLDKYLDRFDWATN